MYFSIGALVISIITLFLPVITYKNSDGTVYSYNVLRLMNGSDFVNHVMADDGGQLLDESIGGILGFFGQMDVNGFFPAFLTIFVTLLGVGAIVASFVGIRSMAKQYESAWPYRLTIIGLVGTAVPAIVILIIYAVSSRYFNQTIQLGAYVFVTPIAMLSAIITVASRHMLTAEEKTAQIYAMEYLKPAGDLPIVERK